MIQKSFTRFSELLWESRYVSSLPGDPEKANFVRQAPGAAYSEVKPTAVRTPALIGWSEPLAAELGIAKPDATDSASVEVLSGSRVLPGMRPYAARYGGHQFGHWAGQLGDGRAITLGEVSFSGRGPLEFQLKGAGPTPYSRRADGRAVLRSSVREFLCSEAMHFLGVPTTRALSLVTTGEVVIRDMFYDGNPRPEPGAIVCRVSPSFLRFGNFEIHASTGEEKLLKQLTDHLIREHYPELDLQDPDVYGKLLDEIARRTSVMISHWMRVGFVHGVMNTDNMSALGLTIDYGPYGWLEPYDPNWTPNTTDAEGRRYRFGNQPAIAFWNFVRLCEALYSLVGKNEERLQRSIAIYRESFAETYGSMLAQKLGLSSVTSEDDQKLVEELFGLLQATETDYTIFFRALSNVSHTLQSDSEADESFLERINPAFYSSELHREKPRSEWLTWLRRYRDRCRQDSTSDEERMRIMKLANPKYVLRNYLAQNAITAAEKGDLTVLERLLRVLQTPYDEQPEEEDLAVKRPDWARSAPGCSALSCSS